MERVDVKTLGLAAILTLILFMGVYGTSMLLEQLREKTVTEQMETIIADFEEIEATAYLMDYLAEQNDSCALIKQDLEYLESKLWLLDGKIKSYGEITRDFEGDEFYIKEKKRLNQREVIHLSLIEKTERVCGREQTLILYFYGSCDQNPCEGQGYVLTTINQQIDPEIAILSFDADLQLHSVDTLIRYYNVTYFPCVVIEGHTHCGLHDRDEMTELLCSYSNLSICQ